MQTDLLGQLRLSEWLRQPRQRDKARRHFGKAARKNYGKLWPFRADRLRKLRSGHVGHNLVRYNHIDGIIAP